jgi:membrane fusion protein (multidrug efflux system)
MKMNIRFSLGLALTAAAITGCSQGPAVPPRHAVSVGTVTLQAQPVTLQSELAGRTVASLVSEVRPQVTGIVKARLFEEGAEVKAGQVLYEIDPAPYESAFEEAQAGLANAEAVVAAAKLKDERYADLLKIEGVSKQDSDDAAAAHRQAVASVAEKKAALKTARINLGYTRVRAPISGRIGKSSVTVGALVTSAQSTALATIRTLDPIYVDLTQSSAQLLKLRQLLEQKGTSKASHAVRLKLEDGSEYSLAGTLKFHEVAVDEATGSVTLRAQFPNPTGVLLPGMYVRAQVNEAVADAGILAPQQGVTRDAKGNAIAMVVNGNNQVEQRTLTTARAIGTNWLVTGGLNAGDRIIVQGLNKIRPGDTVAPVALNIDGKEPDARSASNLTVNPASRAAEGASDAKPKSL